MFASLLVTATLGTPGVASAWAHGPGGPSNAESSSGTAIAFRVTLDDLIGHRAATKLPASSAAPAASQAPSRRDQLLEQRRAAAQDVEPASYPRFWDWLATIENVGTTELFSWQIKDLRVGWGKLTPNSGLAPAMRLERPRIADTPLRATLGAGVSVSGYQSYGLQFGFLDEPAPREAHETGYIGVPFDWDNRSHAVLYKYLYFNASYDNLPRERFFGLGDGSLEEDESTYRYEVGAFGLNAGWQIARGFAIQGRGGYATTNVGPGTLGDLPASEEIFDENTAPGVTDQPNFIYYGAGVFGGHSGDPGRVALLAGVSVDRWDDADRERFEFTSVEVDARLNLPLWARNRIIATRIWTVLSYPDEGADVPFYLMRYLGGNQRLRGYQAQRFRDQNLVYVSSEYRWEAASGVELAFFYDAGKVFADRADWGFDDLRNSYGFGIRGKVWLHTVFRLDLGHGDEGTFLWFAFGPAF